MGKPRPAVPGRSRATSNSGLTNGASPDGCYWPSSYLIIRAQPGWRLNKPLQPSSAWNYLT